MEGLREYTKNIIEINDLWAENQTLDFLNTQQNLYLHSVA